MALLREEEALLKEEVAKETLCHGAGPEGAGAPAALLKALDTGCTGC